jgi:CDP-L-myo-inositol myo-inositolphosphotransferase
MITKAIIIAGGLGRVTFDSLDGVPKPLLEVASMSLIKRSLLSARKAGIHEFLILIDKKEKQIKSLLEEDRQLADLKLEWIYFENEGPSLAHVLDKGKAALKEGFLVITADSVFHPHVLKPLQEALPRDGKVLVCVGDKENDSNDGTGNHHHAPAEAGIYFYSAQALRSLESDPVLSGRPLQSVNKILVERGRVEYLEVTHRQWQRIDTAADLQAANRKIEQWLYKPTDGLFAGWNRQVSIPISRLLIKTSITPNQVTIFTLFLSLISGGFFALGGYLNTLIGAILSQLGSILDGCDGEVARFKFMESEFGCWLETICDYVYYIAVYVGMCIGLYRETGHSIYPVTGALILFGCLIGFFAVSYQRRKFSDKGKPEEYGTNIIRRLEANQHNLLYYFASQVNFLAKRAALPYFILFFAIFGDERFLFFMSALGTNLFWMLTLYSNRLFR